MENRLKNFKKSIDNTTFTQLTFTDQHRKAIHEKINKQDKTEEEIVLAVMQLLVHEKSGFELTNQMSGRGIRKFEDNEGFLYILLHRLEQAGCLQASWGESGVKLYQLTKKGTKLLRKAEERQTKTRFVLKEIIEGLG